MKIEKPARYIGGEYGTMRVAVAVDREQPVEDVRAAVVLCDVEGLSYEEIAEIMGAKLGTVRSRIHRGRTMLRKALAHREPAAGRSRYSGPLAPTTRGTVS